MNVDGLVQQLGSDLKPVRRLAAPGVYFGFWAALTYISLLALTFSRGHGINPDLMGSFATNPKLLIETLAGLAIAPLAAMQALRLGRPDLAERSPEISYAIFFALALFSGLLVFGMLFSSPSAVMLPKRPACVQEVYAFTAVSMIGFFVIMRRTAPLNTWLTGALIGLAAGAPAMAMMHVACDTTPLHVFKFHFMPVAVGTVIAVLVAQRLMRWWPRAKV